MKNKKIIIIIAIVLITVNLTGCTSTTVKKEVDNETSSMFIVVENTSIWDVVYHKETKVMYTISRGGYNQGTFTLLVDSEGNPLLWEEN